jgi:hypothetical protein
LIDIVAAPSASRTKSEARQNLPRVWLTAG